MTYAYDHSINKREENPFFLQTFALIIFLYLYIYNINIYIYINKEKESDEYFLFLEAI